VVFDEGTDTPMTGTGLVRMDNLDVNGKLIGKPGNSKNEAQLSGAGCTLSRPQLPNSGGSAETSSGQDRPDGKEDPGSGCHHDLEQCVGLEGSRHHAQ
jgi:hypothetical protein